MLWLKKLQLRSSKPEARLKAAQALGDAKQERAVPALIEALQDEDSRVQTAAAEALSRIPHPAARAPLISLLAKRADQTVAMAVAATGPPAVKPLVELLASEDKNTRRWCVHALGLIGDPQAVGPLSNALQDRRSEVRQEAALSLGKIGSPDAIACLVAALSHRDLETRRAAIEALGLAGQEAAVDALVPLTDDRDEPSQLAAVQALAKIGGMRAAVGLRSALESGRKAVREAAAAALQSMQIEPAGPEDRATIAILAADFDAALREGDGAVQALIQALASRDSGRRLRATESLVKLGSEKSIQALLQLLRHHEPEMRDTAACALASVGVPVLKGLLDVLAVKAQASQVLASRTAAEALEQLLRANAATVPQEDLKRLAELPEPVLMREDGRTEVAADCTAIRSLARQELLRRAQPN